MSFVHKAFDEMSEPVLCSNESQIVSVEANNAHNLFATNEMSVSDNDILQQGEVVCGAQSVFDKLSEPILSSNSDQVALIADVDDLQPGVNGVPEPYVDGIVPNYARTAHSLFHKMPIPDFILEMAKAAKTTQEENEDMVDAHQLFDTMSEQTEQANASQTICQAAMINNENTLIQNDHFTHKQQLFALPLDAIDASYFNDLVIINASRERFSRLHSLISCSCPPLDQTPNMYNEFYNGNSDLEYPYLQVTIKLSLSFVEIESGVLYKGIFNIDYDDVVWNMISEPICFYRFVFDPGVLLRWVSNCGFFAYSKLFESKMEQRANLPYEKVHSWEKLEVELLGWVDSLVYTFQASSFHNFVNCLLSSAIKYEIVRIIALNSNHAHTDMVSIHLKTLNFLGSSSENTDLMIVHCIDLEPSVLQAMHHLSYGLDLLSYDITCSIVSYDLGDYTSTMRMSAQYILFDPGILGSDTQVSVFTHTLEDKDDFRGEEDASKECTSELLDHQVLWFNVDGKNKSIVLLTYVFDPGGLNCQCAMWAEHLPNSRLSSVWRFMFHVGEIFVVAANHVSLQAREGICYQVVESVLGRLIYQEARISTLILLWVFEPDSVGVRDMMLSTCKLFNESLKLAIKWLANVVVPFILKSSGLKYNPSQVEGLLSEFLKAVAATETTTYNLAQLELLPKFHSCNGQSFALVTIWVFDPGGMDDVAAVDLPKCASTYGNLVKLFYATHHGLGYVIIYMSFSGVYYAMSCLSITCL